MVAASTPDVWAYSMATEKFHSCRSGALMNLLRSVMGRKTVTGRVWRSFSSPSPKAAAWVRIHSEVCGELRLNYRI